MAYLFHQSCYTTPAQLYTAMAADCPVMDNGNSITCVPSETGYQVSKFDGSNTTTYTVTPNLIDCTPDIPQVLELTGYLTALLMAAFAIQMMKRPIR